MDIDPTTTKYLIKARMNANGVVEKPDVIGAIFGQTEGLLGDELDLRDLQKSGRIGRIEVSTDSEGGQTEGQITLPSSLDKVETSILAAALESIDRIGPCEAEVEVDAIDDVRESKRARVRERAKELLDTIGEGEATASGGDIVSEVKKDVKVEELVAYGSEHLPAGPNVSSSDAIIVVEGRNDVSNLLENGIKNAIATEGTSIPDTIKELTQERVTTAFVDGDRGGKLLLKELLQVADLDFIAKAPQSHEVEELTQKQVMKAIRAKLPTQQFLEEWDLQQLGPETTQETAEPQTKEPEPEPEEEEEPEAEEEAEDEEERYQEPPEKEDPSTADTAKAQLSTYSDKLSELSGDLEGVLFDPSGDVTHGPIPVRDLAETLREEGQGQQAVVFDGVITQRLLEIAQDKGIQTVVGMKMGNVTQKPDGVDVYTRDDL
ncbi:hypothetical protein BRD56_04520 [Thermoplasmatales archaeon SW_10_69_26]|nr:MAG: hypothetical protein BRD56_04520 [Thermoplasmatales archaeon SW_10_69_26]